MSFQNCIFSDFKSFLVNFFDIKSFFKALSRIFLGHFSYFLWLLSPFPNYNNVVFHNDTYRESTNPP